MIETFRRLRRYIRRPGPHAPAGAATGAALLALLLAACAATAPWARGTGSAGPLDEARRAEYEVDCTECRVSYTVPDEGRRNQTVTDSWRQSLLAEPGSTLSIDVDVTDAVAIRAASVRIRVDGEVVAADTLWRSSERRTISANHMVRSGPVDPVMDAATGDGR